MKTTKLGAVQDLVEAGATAVAKTTIFSDWLSEESEGDGLVAINNSFVYRDLVKTTKNAQYLCLPLKGDKSFTEPVSVARPQSFNTDFKFFKAASKIMPETQTLDGALQAELKSLGSLVFVLIGQIEEVTCDISIDHNYAHLLRFDPTQKETSAVTTGEEGERSITVNELVDPEAAWNEIQATVQGDIGDEAEVFRAQFSVAFDKLQQEAQSSLQLPSPGGAKSQSSFLGHIRGAVKDQRTLYEDALRKTQRAKTSHTSHLNEVLRIAYNFADDAIKVLTLLVSVCDLKGVVLWCTLRQHFELAEAFRLLPWTKIEGKASLKRYQEVINGARNRAFHNLLGFDRSVFSDLTGVTIKARSLTLLPAHGRRKGHTPFDYEDRELVEVLSQLTLAPETAVSMEFWKRNADVMAKFESLLEATEDALWALNGART
jgi:hypothetical protein